MVYKMLDGNGAAVEALKLARVKVIAAYPITPQSSIAEQLSELTANGTLDAKYIRSESEHSALSSVVAAQLTGVRSATATSSVGLALMHEICNTASGLRLPIVMPVVNRALASPWSLWCEHQDAMAERDSGWLQFYCENVQEIIDLTLMAFRIAEDEKVLLPSMICFDGFFLSHSMQKLLVPSQEEADAFVGPYIKKNMWLDPKDPLLINNLTSMEDYTEMKYQTKCAFANAHEVFDRTAEEFYKKFCRSYQMVEGYMIDDAEAAVVSIGSMAGTVKHVVNKLRQNGVKAGAVKITSFRPFPAAKLQDMLKNVKRIAVFDRSCGFGAAGGPLFQETFSALNNSGKIFKNYMGGLGGRDVNEKTVENVVKDILAADATSADPVWIDVKPNPFGIREALRSV